MQELREVERPEGCPGITPGKGSQKNVPEKEIICVLSKKESSSAESQDLGGWGCR